MRFTADQMEQWQVREPSVERCARGPTRLRGDPVYQRRSFVYQGQTRERPSSVTFELGAGAARGQKRAREELEAPLALVGPDGAADPMVFHMDRFHLVAHRWGGSKDGENLVPAYAGFNRTEWSNFEGAIDEIVRARGGPVRVTIDLGYDDAQDPRVPVRLHVKVEEEIHGIFVQRHKGWFVPTPPAAQRAEDRWLEELITQHRDDFVNSGFSAHALRDPSGMLLNLPNEPGPHAILDYLHARGAFAGTTAENVVLQNGAPFTPAQRDLILAHNRILNGTGFVMSESPADPARTSWPAPPGRPPGTLLDGSTHAAPQVDHTWPQAHNGSNAYSNAMVTSAQHNNEKRNSVTPQIQAEAALNARRSQRPRRGPPA
ncbi:DNA/RNA non-specific endonuclease [Polyangium spumosum]|uniref:Uncharacterized protein n=1 Tax=Polyangium spumosum TaxID=889282 RepID=A0A6N7Q002_9BACT|nr:DNA/RNA non-specific endonuclease [Polyangium spumosum]MRG97573.1 hypothetical protein [Polyangium spumosum]